MTDTALRSNQGKPRLSELLYFDNALDNLAAVLEQGSHKYAKHNWLLGGKPDSEYLDAALRHIRKHKLGELYDDETGCLHLAHAAWNLLACQALNYATEPSIDPDFDQEAFVERWSEPDAKPDLNTPEGFRSYFEALPTIKISEWRAGYEVLLEDVRLAKERLAHDAAGGGLRIKPDAEHFGDAALQAKETELAAERQDPIQPPIARFMKRDLPSFGEMLQDQAEESEVPAP